MITLLKANEQENFDAFMLLGLYDTALITFGEEGFYFDGCFLYKIEDGFLYFCDEEVKRLPLRSLIDA